MVTVRVTVRILGGVGGQLVEVVPDAVAGEVTTEPEPVVVSASVSR